MHHDSQKYFCHNFYLFFPICKRKKFRLFQLLENSKKNVLMHRPVAKDCPWINVNGRNPNRNVQLNFLHCPPI
jgi:hypothetical protein